MTSVFRPRWPAECWCRRSAHAHGLEALGPRLGRTALLLASAPERLMAAATLLPCLVGPSMLTVRPMLPLAIVLPLVLAAILTALLA